MTIQPAELEDMPMSEWLPIDSEASEGISVLLSDRYRVVAAYWDADFGWMTLEGDRHERRAWTHWMPLPAPPEPHRELV